jgi:hypothetical protein
LVASSFYEPTPFFCTLLKMLKNGWRIACSSLALQQGKLQAVQVFDKKLVLFRCVLRDSNTIFFADRFPRLRLNISRRH